MEVGDIYIYCVFLIHGVMNKAIGSYIGYSNRQAIDGYTYGYFISEI